MTKIRFGTKAIEEARIVLRTLAILNAIDHTKRRKVNG